MSSLLHKVADAADNVADKVKNIFTGSPKFFGPVLHFRGRSADNKWTVRLFAGFQAGDGKKRCVEWSVNTGTAGNNVSKKDGNFTVKGSSENIWEFHFVDVTIPMGDAEQSIEYTHDFQVEGSSDIKKTYEFLVPAKANDPLTFYYSCNDLPTTELREKDKTIYDAWECVRRQGEFFESGGEKSKLHLLIGGGDNLYADDVLVKALTNQEFANDFDGLMDFYIGEYIRRFTPWGGDKNMCHVMATVPMLMQCDDHDYYNGFGSFTKARRLNSKIGLAAHITRFAFQLGQSTVTNKDTAEDNMENATRVFQLGPQLALLSLDFRANRDIELNRMMPMDLFNKKLLECEELVKTMKAKHLIVLFASPVVWTHEKFAEMVASATKHLPVASIFATDALDSLRADCNVKQTTEMCHGLFRLAQEHGVRLTFVSGDIHNAAHGTLRAKDLDVKDDDDFRFAQNWTSSPMCNWPNEAEKGEVLQKMFQDKDNHFEFAADPKAADPQPLVGSVDLGWMEKRNFMTIYTRHEKHNNEDKLLLCGQLYLCNKKISEESEAKDVASTKYEPIEKEWISKPTKPFAAVKEDCCAAM